MSSARRIPFRPLLAYGVAGALTTIAWSRLQGGGADLVEVAIVLAVGLVPILALVVGARRLVVGAAAVLATIVAAAVAFEISPLEARPGSDHDFFGPVFGSSTWPR